MATAAPQAQLLVIAAPRPFGLPDLERIQAGRTEGRFFVRAPLHEHPSLRGLAHPLPMLYAYRLLEQRGF